MTTCSNGHTLQEVSRRNIQETVEDVVYRKERIKHFDREGSEFWTEINVPSIEEREVSVELVELQCLVCGETKTVRETKMSREA